MLALVLGLSTASGQQRQITAYDALMVVGNQLNRAALKRVISVKGMDGDPQPVEWTLLLADRDAPGGVREIQVADGQIVGNRTPNEQITGTTEGATINTAQLNLDSSGAFTVASYTADKSHTNFDRVSYTLRTNERGLPVWIVTIQDEARNPVGTIHISAQRGNVTRVEGLYRGANMAHVEQDPGESVAASEEYAEPGLDDEAEVEGDDPDDNVVKAEIKRMFRRTKRDAKRLFRRVRRPFDEVFNRG